MELTLREEIIILTACFCFCIFAIPIMIFNSKANDIHHAKIKRSSESEFTSKLLIDSLEILDTLNLNKTSNKSLVALADLINANEKSFRSKYASSLQTNSFTAKQKRRRMRSVWRKFKFSNGTVLRSKSLKLPTRVDWRESQVISRVKKQSSTCGSCFALSVIETIESMVAIKTGNLTELSEQQMLNCNGYDMNCNGGNPCLLLDWLLSSQTDVQLNSDYPRLPDMSQTQQCKSHTSKQTGIKVKDYSCGTFKRQEEVMLLYLAYQGPLIATIDGLPLISYKGGTVRDCGTAKGILNHAVQIVGYDITEDVPFYIVKNSWGPTFGDNGFMNIAIGKNACGIAESVVAVVV